MLISQTRKFLSAPLMTALVICVLSGCGKSQTPVEEAGDAVSNLGRRSSPQEIDRALMGGQCDGAAKGAFMAEGEQIGVADLPSGEYEYQWGELFVSEIEKGKLLQVHIVDTSPGEETYLGARKCVYGLTTSTQLKARGSFPKGFHTTEELAFRVEKNRKFELSIANGEVIQSVADSSSGEEATRQSARTEIEKARAAGVEMKMYRLNENTFKLVVIFRSHEGPKTSGIYSTGFYKYTPPSTALPLR